STASVTATAISIAFCQALLSSNLVNAIRTPAFDLTAVCCLLAAIRSHIPSVLTTNLKHSLSQLTKAAVLGRLHQDLEHILIPDRRFLKIAPGLLPFLRVRLLEVLDGCDLGLLLGFGGADHFAREHGGRAFATEEGV